MVVLAVPRIQRLSPALANQIAAGEIVERPASVLKELVENSLDAGAQRIEVEIEAGGIGLIRVRDDGCGIHHDDLRLALSSHTTSKIHQEEELLSITTLGFRGEALASIGAVSHLSLSSRMVGAEYGWNLHENRSVQPIAHPIGTTVEVRDLFYNTPARRHFLRGEKTEFIHLRATLERLALGRFEVSFRMSHNRRPILSSSAYSCPTKRLKRVIEICGRTFSERSLYFEQEAGGLRLWGWLGHPECSRSQTNSQYFYVNQRMVRDRLLSHAARQAYGNRLPPGRHPLYLLNLELPTNQVDVNAHPAKYEVRFREARQIHGFIARTLTELLEQTDLEGPLEPTIPALYSQKTDEANQLDTVAESSEHYSATPAKKHTSLGNGSLPLGQAQALVLERYILAENSKGLVLVDVLAARVRLIQARLRTAYASGDHLVWQPLLLPLTFNVPLKQAEWVEQHSSKLIELGFGLHRLGPQVLVLREIAAPIRELNLEKLLPALLLQLAEQKQKSLDDRVSLGEIVVNLAVRYPLPTPPRSSPQEMNTLLRDLENIYQNKATNTEEKPPWQEWQKNEIERWFSLDY